MNNPAIGAPAECDSASPSASTTGRLLIVDDLADNRALLTRRFVRRGFEIVEASGGHEALAALETQEFDCVLLDWMMPEMNGDVVLQRIREKFASAVLPVIMITAKDQSEDLAHALKLGADDYVTKPVDFAVALARVVNQVERGRTQRGAQQKAKSLEVAKFDLEQRVLDRTFKLRQANAAVQREVALRMASEDQMAYLAHHDALTGLPNRHSFDEKLNESRARAGVCGYELAILFVDLDGFKNVNDTLGHEVGDELLRVVAAEIASQLQRDDFCARFGGDEFVVVHLATDAQRSAEGLARSLIAAIGKVTKLSDHLVHVGASIGGVVSSGTESPSELLRRADLAMYRAKADGRGVYRLFEPEMSLKALHRRNLEIDLRAALANGEFELYYQPVVELEARNAVGFEGLLRWKHPTRGFVPPNEFIGVAEETGFIVPIGAWALRRACLDAVAWPSNLRVAINLSPVQFRSPDLVSTIADALAVSGLAPGRLELEITETVLLSKSQHNLKVLEEIKALGVRISLDDFGAGYSGFSYFRDFKFDKMKIDQTFVRDMVQQPECHAIVRAAIGLGSSLGIGITAEGVENVAQLASLTSEGCTEVQGYLFGTPQPNDFVARAVENIRNWRDD